MLYIGQGMQLLVRVSSHYSLSLLQKRACKANVNMFSIVVKILHNINNS